jgi:hypothetical protein
MAPEVYKNRKYGSLNSFRLCQLRGLSKPALHQLYKMLAFFMTNVYFDKQGESGSWQRRNYHGDRVPGKNIFLDFQPSL